MRNPVSFETLAAEHDRRAHSVSDSPHRGSRMRSAMARVRAGEWRRCWVLLAWRVRLAKPSTSPLSGSSLLACWWPERHRGCPAPTHGNVSQDDLYRLLQRILLGYEPVVRARLLNDKFIVYVRIHEAQNNSTLEIALSNIHQDVLVLLNVADVHQCSKVDFPCCFVCLLYGLLSFHIHSCLRIWNFHCLG